MTKISLEDLPEIQKIIEDRLSPLKTKIVKFFSQLESKQDNQKENNQDIDDQRITEEQVNDMLKAQQESFNLEFNNLRAEIEALRQTNEGLRTRLDSLENGATVLNPLVSSSSSPSVPITSPQFLFKADFEKSTSSGLEDDEIEKWRSKTIGLNAEEARVAFDNKWEPNDIKAAKVAKYSVNGENEKNINPLLIDKEQLGNALKLLSEINDPNKNTFTSLPANFKELEIESLVDDLLPDGKKQQDLTNRIVERRQQFFYHLHSDTFLTPESLTKAEGKLTDQFTIKKRNPITSQILNELLAPQVKDGKGNPLKKLPATKEVVDLEPWLTNDENKGYHIENEPEQEIFSWGEKITISGKEVLEQEEKWNDPNSPEFDRSKQGAYLLPFYYKKVNFDPDNPVFCDRYENPTDGELPIGTGVGKTTKTIACLCRGGQQSIVLVCPTGALANSALNHHLSWLQDWTCVYHGVKHGPYPVGHNRLVNKGVSILEPGYLLGYLAREMLTYTAKGIKGIEKTPRDEDFEGQVKILKDGKLLKKINPIIVFDEAHFNKSTYQVIMQDTIEMKEDNDSLIYRILKMSATFPGKPFSITSSYPRKCYLIDGFKSEWDEEFARNKTLVFVKDVNDVDIDLLERNNIAHCLFDDSNSSASEGISYGMPLGSIMFADPTYEMGFTFDIDIVIIVNWIQTRVLGGGWQYSKPLVQRLPIASWGQQYGRVGRTRKGICYAFSNIVKEITPTDDAGTIFAHAVLTGDTTKVKYKDFKDIDLTRASIAWPTKFGLYPEEILVGVNKGIKNYPKFVNEYPAVNPDKDLWDRYLKIIKTSKMAPDKAKDILVLMLSTLIKNDKNFPTSLNLILETPLIREVGWLADTKPTKDPNKYISQDNSQVIKEIHSILNSVVVGKIEELKQEGYFSDTKQSKSSQTLQAIADLYSLALNAIVSVKQGEKEELIDKKKPELGKVKKENLTLQIEYSINK